MDDIHKLNNINYKDIPIFDPNFDGLLCFAKPVKVYDGDTITLIWYSYIHYKYVKMNCRLANFNATEMKGGSENDKLHAKEIRDYLTSLICDCDNSKVKTHNKRLIQVRFHINEPKFKRPLVTIYDMNEKNLTYENSINKKIMDKFNLPVYNPSNIQLV